MEEKTCKVFTPSEMVNHMLDKIGYIEDLYEKKVLEKFMWNRAFLM